MSTPLVSSGNGASIFPRRAFCCGDALSVLIVAISLFCLEKRKAEAERIRQKYPDRIPVRYITVSLCRYGAPM
jgi:hypothetical protein